jgi:two-component system, OmpR family, phosphate regulon response regulator PhoB
MTSTADPAPRPAGESAQASTGPLVLVVDDDPRMREVAMWALEDEGFAVAVAANRRQATEQARQRPPALVVLDMSLPPYDGDTVATDLRAICGAQLPILVITADGRATEKAQRVGAYAGLHKPFDVEQLVRLVRERLAG